MALESQGIEIRRASSNLATAASSVITIDSTGILSSDTAEVDFVTAGFGTGMRIVSNSTLTTAVLTAKAVAASAIEIYETATADASTNLSLTGSSMNAIGEVVSFSGPSGAAAVIDITHLGSTAKEKLIGIRDEGNLTMEVNWNNTATALHRTLKDDRAARTKNTFDIKLTDDVEGSTTQPTALFFDAYISGVSLSGAVDDVIKGSITLEISTEVRWISKVAS